MNTINERAAAVQLDYLTTVTSILRDGTANIHRSSMIEAATSTLAILNYSNRYTDEQGEHWDINTSVEIKTTYGKRK